jgi:type II secretory pathway pseudopilin PulG
LQKTPLFQEFREISPRERAKRTLVATLTKLRNGKSRKESGFMKANRGVTLVELLVIITMITLLIALLLPAVQSARESARRVQCMNNLKQLALAVHGYQATWSTLPMGEMPGSLSPNIAILPYLEQSTLYASFNFIVLPEAGWGVGGKVPTWLGAAASTAVATKLNTFICPSEINDVASPTAPSYWPSNYAWNSGTWWPRTRFWDGLFGRSLKEGSTQSSPPDPPLGALGFAACRDGLSTTLLLAEVACGPRLESAQRTKVSDCYQVPGLDDRMTPAEAVAACKAIEWQTSRLPWEGAWRHKGYPWVEGTLWRGWFNTIRTPNQTCCVQGTAGVTAADWWFMLKPASSYHGPIVHAAMADASVHLFKDSINPVVWMGLSTRSGGEVVNDEW